MNAERGAGFLRLVLLSVVTTIVAAAIINRVPALRKLVRDQWS